ncbi:MAG TPA: cobyric acid synthase [Desulfobacteria bacterium]|nr:cobyric acid synthase [Desulfobacteria bacterium]
MVNKAKTVMFQGTSSNVGKSVLAAAFCRIFYQDGYRVAPFKAQNMALNSFVTKDGGEMGRAQVVQAQAAGVEPDVAMNPILLKPTGNACSQVVLLGKPVGNFSAQEYHLTYNITAWDVVQESFAKLQETSEIVVIEGAGSPAEVNLKDRDIVNMRVAKLADAPVFLVADIDRGGALASIVGTLELLYPDERPYVKGIIINKFRGDIKLLQPALDFLEEKTGVPVLGVVPYYTEFSIPEEDSVVLEERRNQSTAAQDKLDIVVAAIPRISNFTDFDPLGAEPDVNLRYVHNTEELGTPDMVILPGSKNTSLDLQFLWESGLAQSTIELAARGVAVVGICGGYQMLGKQINDPDQTESDLGTVQGLGLLDITTTFLPEKVTTQVKGKVYGREFCLADCPAEELDGYEIHMGRTELGAAVSPAFILRRGEDEHLDGAVSGRVMGTYLHGIFDNDAFRDHLLKWLWGLKGKNQRPIAAGYSSTAERERAFNQLADLVRSNLNMNKVRKVIGLD